MGPSDSRAAHDHIRSMVGPGSARLHGSDHRRHNRGRNGRGGPGRSDSDGTVRHRQSCGRSCDKRDRRMDLILGGKDHPRSGVRPYTEILIQRDRQDLLLQSHNTFHQRCQTDPGFHRYRDAIVPESTHHLDMGHHKDQPERYDLDGGNDGRRRSDGLAGLHGDASDCTPLQEGPEAQRRYQRHNDGDADRTEGDKGIQC